MARAIVYYGDRSSVLVETYAEWLAAPSRNLMAVAYNDNVNRAGDVGRRVINRRKNDYYVWWPGMDYPWACDLGGVYDLLIETGNEYAYRPLSDVPPQALFDAGIKFGRSVPDAEWDEIQAWIEADERLRPKSGTRWDERTATRSY